MTSVPRIRAGEAAPPALVRMRRIAGGLLLAMAAIFLVSRHYAPLYPWAGFVQAFSEAAMVGGLADWFAVTALFRHPLGLPIPHTAIVPRNKDRIGDTLATFPDVELGRAVADAVVLGEVRDHDVPAHRALADARDEWRRWGLVKRAAEERAGA